MTGEALQSIVLAALAEVAPDADLGRLAPERTFHDQFGIDSVDFMNLMLTLERRLGVHIPEGDYPRLSTLQGCVRYLEPLVADRRPRTV